jgi:bifunctional non-homologous end joining protein LigD
VLFDLDPGQAAFGDVVIIANELHALFKEEGSKACVKTTGKTGLHVLVPWSRGSYDEARAWAHDIAQRLVAAVPKQATTERSKVKRGGPVYVDILQNAKGHHAVPPYVLRATSAAPVSTPISWREVTTALDPAQFTLQTNLPRLARQKRDLFASLVAPSIT